MDTQEQEWVSGFEGMNEEEILTTPLPPNLSDEACFRFRSLQQEMGARARDSEQLELLKKAERQVALAGKLQPELAEPSESGPNPAMVQPAQPPIPFAIPEGRTDALLDRQIASCAGIIEHLAHYIARYDLAAETCNKFMDRISVMMKSSAEAALAVGRLRGMAPEGRARRW